MAAASDATAVTCTNNSDYAVICSFFEQFGDTFGLLFPSFHDLQSMLENVDDVPYPLTELHVKLMRKLKKSVSFDRWEKAAAKFAHSYSDQDGWEIERFGYKKANLAIKLRLLKNLLEAQFDGNIKFKNEINKVTNSDELRLQPLGKDMFGRRYWHLLDDDCNLRVYREDLEDETWYLVSSDKESMLKLIEQLNSGKEFPEEEDTSPSTSEESNTNSQEGFIKSDPDTPPNGPSEAKRPKTEPSDATEQKTASSDNEGVLCEAIESPVLLVQGEGNGADCDAGNPGEGSNHENEGENDNTANDRLKPCIESSESIVSSENREPGADSACQLQTSCPTRDNWKETPDETDHSARPPIEKPAALGDSLKVTENPANETSLETVDSTTPAEIVDAPEISSNQELPDPVVPISNRVEAETGPAKSSAHAEIRIEEKTESLVNDESDLKISQSDSSALIVSRVVPVEEEPIKDEPATVVETQLIEDVAPVSESGAIHSAETESRIVPDEAKEKSAVSERVAELSSESSINSAEPVKESCIESQAVSEIPLDVEPEETCVEPQIVEEDLVETPVEPTVEESCAEPKDLPIETSVKIAAEDTYTSLVPQVGTEDPVDEPVNVAIEESCAPTEPKDPAESFVAKKETVASIEPLVVVGDPADEPVEVAIEGSCSLTESKDPAETAKEETFTSAKPQVTPEDPVNKYVEKAIEESCAEPRDPIETEKSCAISIPRIAPEDPLKATFEPIVEESCPEPKDPFETSASIAIGGTSTSLAPQIETEEPANILAKEPNEESCAEPKDPIEISTETATEETFPSLAPQVVEKDPGYTPVEVAIVESCSPTEPKDPAESFAAEKETITSLAAQVVAENPFNDPVEVVIDESYAPAEPKDPVGTTKGETFTSVESQVTPEDPVNKPVKVAIEESCSPTEQKDPAESFAAKEETFASIEPLVVVEDPVEEPVEVAIEESCASIEQKDPCEKSAETAKGATFESIEPQITPEDPVDAPVAIEESCALMKMPEDQIPSPVETAIAEAQDTSKDAVNALAIEEQPQVLTEDPILSPVATTKEGSCVSIEAQATSKDEDDAIDESSESKEPHVEREEPTAKTPVEESSEPATIPAFAEAVVSDVGLTPGSPKEVQDSTKTVEMEDEKVESTTPEPSEGQLTIDDQSEADELESTIESSEPVSEPLKAPEIQESLSPKEAPAAMENITRLEAASVSESISTVPEKGKDEISPSVVLAESLSTVITEPVALPAPAEPIQNAAEPSNTETVINPEPIYESLKAPEVIAEEAASVDVVPALNENVVPSEEVTVSEPISAKSASPKSIPIDPIEQLEPIQKIHKIAELSESIPVPVSVKPEEPVADLAVNGSEEPVRIKEEKPILPEEEAKEEKASFNKLTFDYDASAAPVAFVLPFKSDPSTVPLSAKKQRGGRKRGRTTTAEKEEAVVDEAPVLRQSSRIAKLREKEDEDRRKQEAERLQRLKEEHERREKRRATRDERMKEMEAKHQRRQQKATAKSDVVYKEDSQEDDTTSEEEEEDEPRKKGKKRRKRGKKKKDQRPWDSSDSSDKSSESEEDGLEDLHAEEENEELVFKSDHEFSPESDLDGEQVAIQPTKHARTARAGTKTKKRSRSKKVKVEEEEEVVEEAEATEEEEEEEEKEHNCQKCGLSDHPEWILLCDRCDFGWHANCIKPPLMVIPEGDWFCPPCDHATLLERLQERLEAYEFLLTEKEAELVRKKEQEQLEAKAREEAEKQAMLEEEPEEEEEEEGNSGIEDNIAAGGDDVEDDDDEDEGSSGDTEDEGDSQNDSDENLNKRRQRKAITKKDYSFKDYDDMIKSALEDQGAEEEETGGKGKGLGKGPRALDEEDEEEEDGKRSPQTVRPSGIGEKRMSTSDDDSDVMPRVVRGKKKARKLNDLSATSNEDDSDEDFQGSSAEGSDSEDDEELASESDFVVDDDSDDDDVVHVSAKRKGRASSPTIRRSTRAPRKKYQKMDSTDSSEEESDFEVAPKRKKGNESWDESGASSSDASWGRSKKKANAAKGRAKPAPAPKPKPKPPARKAPANRGRGRGGRSNKAESDDEPFRSNVSVKKIKQARPVAEDDGDSDQNQRRTTRGRQINYKEMIDSSGDSQEDTEKKMGTLFSADRNRNTASAARGGASRRGRGGTAAFPAAPPSRVPPADDDSHFSNSTDEFTTAAAAAAVAASVYTTGDDSHTSNDILPPSIDAELATLPSILAQEELASPLLKDDLPITVPVSVLPPDLQVSRLIQQRPVEVPAVPADLQVNRLVNSQSSSIPSSSSSSPARQSPGMIPQQRLIRDVLDSQTPPPAVQLPVPVAAGSPDVPLYAHSGVIKQTRHSLPPTPPLYTGSHVVKATEPSSVIRPFPTNPSSPQPLSIQGLLSSAPPPPQMPPRPYGNTPHMIGHGPFLNHQPYSSPYGPSRPTYMGTPVTPTPRPAYPPMYASPHGLPMAYQHHGPPLRPTSSYQHAGFPQAFAAAAAAAANAEEERRIYRVAQASREDGFDPAAAAGGPGLLLKAGVDDPVPPVTGGAPPESEFGGLVSYFSSQQEDFEEA